MHPAIRLASVAALGAATPPPAEEPPGAAARARATVRRLGGAVLDRVGDRAAAANAEELDRLREELARTRAELEAEIELLRAELEGRGPAS